MGEVGSCEAGAGATGAWGAGRGAEKFGSMRGAGAFTSGATSTTGVNSASSSVIGSTGGAVMEGRASVTAERSTGTDASMAAGRGGAGVSATAGRTGTGLGISRSCQLDIGSGLKLVEAVGMVPKSNDAAGFASTAGADCGATTGAGADATG